MGCIPFANFHFQMGVTVMGFAEDSGLRVIQEQESDLKHKLTMYFTSVDHNINPK